MIIPRLEQNIQFWLQFWLMPKNTDSIISIPPIIKLLKFNQLILNYNIF